MSLEADLERLLTVKEVAEILGVARSTVYGWVERTPPLVPHRRLGSGRVIRFTRADLAELIEVAYRSPALEPRDDGDGDVRGGGTRVRKPD